MHPIEGKGGGIGHPTTMGGGEGVGKGVIFGGHMMGKGGGEGGQNYSKPWLWVRSVCPSVFVPEESLGRESQGRQVRVPHLRVP
jgi:hypothetical protein